MEGNNVNDRVASPEKVSCTGGVTTDDKYVTHSYVLYPLRAGVGV